MSMLELLTKYGNAASVINKHFSTKMIESFENDDEVPEQFIEFMRSHGIDNEHLAPMLDVSPRTLFDVFDDNQIYIHVEGDNKYGWSWEIRNWEGDDKTENAVCASRREAELKAVTAAMEILNNKIKQHERLDSGTISEQIQEEK